MAGRDYTRPPRDTLIRRLTGGSWLSHYQKLSGRDGTEQNGTGRDGTGRETRARQKCGFIRYRGFASARRNRAELRKTRCTNDFAWHHSATILCARRLEIATNHTTNSARKQSKFVAIRTARRKQHGEYEKIYGFALCKLKLLLI